MHNNANPGQGPIYLIRINEVLRRVPMSRASFYAGVRAGLYPAPVRIGKRAVAWRARDIDGLIESFRPPSALPL